MIQSVNEVSSVTDLKLALADIGTNDDASTVTNTNTNTNTNINTNINGRSKRQQSLQFDDPILRAMQLRDVAISTSPPPPPPPPQPLEDLPCHAEESDVSPPKKKQRSDTDVSSSSDIDQFLHVPAADTPFSSRAWVLDNHDPATTFPQTLDAEMRRLLVLRSYFVLNTEEDVAKMGFEAITRLASRMLDCPMAAVSLSDINCQWFLAQHGLSGEGSEVTRKNSFCAHAILSKDEDAFVVNDASQDSRFQENPWVTGPLHVRFYAGVPLVSSEGYKLGTLCVFGSEPRPDGLTLEDKQNLKDLADMVVEVMAQHRREKMRAHFDNPKQTIAQMANELLAPLMGVQLNLSTLAKDRTLAQQMTSEEQELLNNAMYCSDAVAKICAAAIDDFRHEQDGLELAPEQGDTLDGCKRSTFFRKIPNHSEAVQTKNLIQAWFIILETFPKNVPVGITTDPNVPDEIFVDELKVFRATLNYLSNACQRTVKGSIQLVVKMVSSDTDGKVRSGSESSRAPVTLAEPSDKATKEEDDGKDPSHSTGTEVQNRRKVVSSDEYKTPETIGEDSNMKDGSGPSSSDTSETQRYLFVECIDTAPNIPVENYPLLFHPSEYHESMECIRPTPNGGCEPICRMQSQGLGLYSVAIQIGSIGGKYGFHPRVPSRSTGVRGGNIVDDDVSTSTSATKDVDGNLQGSIFWFKVPMHHNRGTAVS